MSLPPPLTDLELLARARGLSNGIPPNEREVRLLASELSVCRNILDKLVEESSCSICYRPLRSMHVIECGHSFCTECIRNEFKENGMSHDIHVHAFCPACRLAIALELNEDKKLHVPDHIMANDQLPYLRLWAKLRRVTDEVYSAHGIPIPETAYSWRRQDVETHYKTRAEEEAEDNKVWVNTGEAGENGDQENFDDQENVNDQEGEGNFEEETQNPTVRALEAFIALATATVPSPQRGSYNTYMDPPYFPSALGPGPDQPVLHDVTHASTINHHPPETDEVAPGEGSTE
ncbi:hypothetical protein CH063_01001 [Colletotrichum higginsianum]|nr:E3 ubiquitin-protein ligase TRIM21 [Colletotrichum higginsianum]CCF33655.1 hypothetical protein CH063_01001 [Colletotrichum higginsianum]